MGTAAIIEPRLSDTPLAAAPDMTEGRDREAALRAALKNDPHDTEVLAALALLLARAGHASNALVYLTRASADPAAIGVLRDTGMRCLDILEQQQEHPTPPSDTARRLAALPDEAVWPQARQALAHVLGVAIVDGSEADSCTGTERLLKLARAGRNADDLPPAVSAALTRARDDDDSDAWFLLGREALEQDNPETACLLLEQAATLDPESIRKHVYLARCQMRLDRAADAFATYSAIRHAAAENQSDSHFQDEATEKLALLGPRMMGHVDKAIAEEDADLAWSLFQNIGDQMDEDSRAERRTEILRISREAVMQAHRDSADNTVELAQAHLDRDPRSVYVRQVLGQELAARSQHEKAAEIWGELAVSVPDNPRMHLQHAHSLERSGEIVAAREAVERALHLNPFLEAAKSLQARLGSQEAADAV